MYPRTARCCVRRRGEAAFPEWRALGADRRGELLQAAAELIDQEGDALGSLLTSEMGRPWRETRFEARQLVGWLRHFGEMKLEPVIIRDNGKLALKAVRRPIGVVAASTPWNGPLGTLGMKVGPALSAGNTVVTSPRRWRRCPHCMLGSCSGTSCPQMC